MHAQGIPGSVQKGSAGADAIKLHISPAALSADACIHRPVA
jgi:hypothetical protein